MRDIGAEAFNELWNERLQAQPQKPQKKKIKKRRRSLRLFVGLFLLLLGGFLGAIPSLLELWSGQHGNDLSIEATLQYARNPATKTEQLRNLHVRLLFLGKEGITVIHSLKKRGGGYASAAGLATSRLRSLLNNRRLARQNRRVTGPITYAQALKTLASPPGPTAVTWDSLEVVVFQIEEALLLLQARETTPGTLGRNAEIILSNLKTLLEL